MLVGDYNLYPKDWVSTLSIASFDGIITEKKFYNCSRSRQTANNWSFKWVYTPIENINDSEYQDIEVIVNTAK